MRNQRVWRLSALSVAALLAGCSTQAVRCEGHLTPINVPRSAAGDPGPGAEGVGDSGSAGKGSHFAGKPQGRPAARADLKQGASVPSKSREPR